MKRNNSRKKNIRVALISFVFLMVAVSGVRYSAFANETLFRNIQVSSELEKYSGVISAQENGIELTATYEPWSTERMEQAIPYPLPDVNSLPEITTNQFQSNGEPGYFPSIPPANNHNGEPSPDDPLIQSSFSTSGYDKPAPYTRYEIFDSYQVFPYSTVGVLFFTQNSVDYRCSAAVVGENALWTAGHCVHDGIGNKSGWSENVAFVPAYKDGNEPYGRWVANNLHTRLYWFNNQDLRFDIGGVVLEPNGSDQSVQEVVGSLGFAYNMGPSQHWFNFGYPSAFPFNGKTMQICAGSFARLASGTSYPNPVGMGCDMTPGSSGGPWIIHFNGFDGNTNYLNGNNSFRFTDDPEDFEELYSPYFGITAWELFSEISPESASLTNFFLPTTYSNYGK